MPTSHLLAIAFTFSFITLMVAIMLIHRPTDEQRKMAVRFDQLTNTGASVLVSEDGSSLLRSVEHKALYWHERLLPMLATAFKLDLLLLQADRATSVQTLLLSCVVAGACGAVLVFCFLPHFGIALIGGIGATYLPVLFFKVLRMRRLAAFDRALPDAIEMMSRALRAGHSMIAAISIVADHAVDPVKAEFAEVFRKQNFGLPLRDALMYLLDRIPSQDLRLLVTGMLVQRDTGGNLAQILDRIVSVIRERFKIQGEIRTHTAQGRLTGWILCLMPVGLLLVLNIINPGYSKPLTTDSLGIKIVYAGIALLLFGAFLIKRIIDAIEV